MTDRLWPIPTKTGLATVGGIGFEIDPQSQNFLLGRGLGSGLGKHYLRTGLDDYRLVADDVFVGDISLDQEWNHGSHPDRLKGPIPVCVFMSPASMHDVNWLGKLTVESGAIYLFDKGHIDFIRL